MATFDRDEIEKALREEKVRRELRRFAATEKMEHGLMGLSCLIVELTEWLDYPSDLRNAYQRSIIDQLDEDLDYDGLLDNINDLGFDIAIADCVLEANLPDVDEWQEDERIAAADEAADRAYDESRLGY